MDWTEKKAEDAARVLRGWWPIARGDDGQGVPSDRFIRAIADDLNVPAALSELHALHAAGDFPELVASARLIGLLQPGMGEWTKPLSAADPLYQAVASVVDVWSEARAKRDFALADQIRNDAAKLGVELFVSDSKTEQASFKAFRVAGETIAGLKALADRARP